MAEEAKKPDENAPPPQTNSMAAFSDQMKDLEDALGLLYITRNLSGRLKFKDKWPEVAEYLFGDELIGYDINGFEDLDRRAELEDEANDRRIMLKKTLTEIVKKSVDAGSLMFDYVGSVIDQYGPRMSKYLYAPEVIERVRPGVLAKSEEEAKLKAETKAAEASAAPKVKEETPKDDLADTQTVSDVSEELDANIEDADDMNETAALPEKDENEDTSLRAADEKLSQEEKSILSNKEDMLDNVRPIETGAPPLTEPVAQETTAPSVEEAAEKTTPPLPEDVAPFLSEDSEKVKAQAGLTPLTAQAKEEEKPAVAEPVVAEPEAQVSAPQTPDILKPPPAAEVVEEPVEAPKVEELTAPQAAKAERGVYKTIFNALAKPA